MQQLPLPPECRFPCRCRCPCPCPVPVPAAHCELQLEFSTGRDPACCTLAGGADAHRAATETLQIAALAARDAAEIRAARALSRRTSAANRTCPRRTTELGRAVRACRGGRALAGREVAAASSRVAAACQSDRDERGGKSKDDDTLHDALLVVGFAGLLTLRGPAAPALPSRSSFEGYGCRWIEYCPRVLPRSSFAAGTSAS